ncbi:hypothetical protein AGMMS49925_06340 [Deltaproteobacteria bacterium]|nr:hypothetical protein AGMMS49925_06340 [Deltaproteobacteria bacterium]
MRKNVVLEKSLREMGQGIKIARLRRRLQLAVIAERAGISVITLYKIEKGMAGIAVSNVAAVFWALGLGTPLGRYILCAVTGYSGRKRTVRQRYLGYRRVGRFTGRFASQGLPL